MSTVTPIASVAARRPFNPGHLNPVVWLDASASATVTLNGSRVSSWSNKGSYGGSYTQPTASAQPTYYAASTGFPSKPSLFMQTRWMSMAGMPALTAMSEYAVFRINAGVAGNDQCVTNYGEARNIDTKAVTVTIQFNASSTHWANASNKGAFTVASYGANRNFRRYWSADATSQTPFGSPTRVVVNDVEYTKAVTPATAPGTFASGTWRLGAQRDIADLPFYGEIHEIIVFDRVLTAEEYDELDAYAVSKYADGSWG